MYGVATQGHHKKCLGTPDWLENTTHTTLQKLEKSSYIVPAKGSKARISSCVQKMLPKRKHGHSTKILFTAVFSAFMVLDPCTLRPDWRTQTQIRSIIASLEYIGLLNLSLLEDRLEFHVVLSCGELMKPSAVINMNVEHACSKAINETIGSRIQTLPNVFVHMHNGNAFEWPAIHMLWLLARNKPDRKFLYFHNKGARHLRSKNYEYQRYLVEMVLFRETVAPFQAYLDLFAAYPDLASAGLIKSHLNIPWINFFWASGDLISSVDEPPKTDDRFFFEMKWLVDHRSILKDGEQRRVAGKSFCAESCNFDKFYHQKEVSAIILPLIHKMKQELIAFPK
jgi:hypothetical protein